MNSRDRLVAALTFNRPDRVPRDLWALPYIPLFRKAELDALLEKYPMVNIATVFETWNHPFP